MNTISLALGLLVACAPPPKSVANVVPHEPSTVMTWLMHPPTRDPQYPDAFPASRLVLVVGDDHIELERQYGKLWAHNQSACADKTEFQLYPLRTGEVAMIAFDDRGTGGSGYLVRQTPRGLALIAWAENVFMCANEETRDRAACPRHESEIRLLAIPTKRHVVQQIVNVDAAGKPTPFDCSG